MLKSRRNRIVAAGAALVAAIVTTAAVAASGALSSSEDSEAVVNDAAEQLGVEPSELSDALKQALKNRVDEAVEAGRLTEAQGAELKERIDANEVPLFGFGHGPHGPGHGHFGGLDAAAEYLGLSQDELRTSLMEGQTLAEIARAEGKSVDGLVDAMVADARERLDQAVEDGRLTEAQRDEIASTLEERITAKVNGELRGRPGPGPGFGLPPDQESEPGDGSGSGSGSSATTFAA
jgi:hypothetical protein